MKKMKINTYVAAECYKAIRKMAIDLERPWSDLLEEGIILVLQKYGYSHKED